MKDFSKLLLLIIAGATYNGKAQEETDNNGYDIRVLLEENNPQKPCILTLNAKNGFTLESPANSKMFMPFQDRELLLTLKDGLLYMKCQDGINRRIELNDIKICSQNNIITLNNQSYQGNIRICQDKKTGSILIINTLGLEDYLYSVVRYESIPSWPYEVQKVQAIASRTYALYHMKQSRTNTPQSLYDLTNNIYRQVYKGLHGETYLRRAIKETHNMVLTYNGKIAEAMFGACCGGIIPNNLRELYPTDRSYLYRNSSCKYCKNSIYFDWKEVFHKNKLLYRLKSSPKCNEKLQYFKSPLANMKVTDKDEAGVVHKVDCIMNDKKIVTLAGAKVRKALRLKSLAFSIKKTGDLFVFDGHGYHHFKGLCQWGAKTLADKGLNYKEILQFYYPNTKISYLKE